MLKKISAAVLGFILLIIVALWAIPIFFQDAINKKVNTLVNANVNGDIQIENVGISFFTAFPSLTVSLEGVIVKPLNKDQQLIKWDRFDLQCAPLAYVFDDQVVVEELHLNGLEAYVWTNMQGEINLMQLIKTSEEAEATQDEVPTELPNIAVEAYSIQANKVVYMDSVSNMNLTIVDFEHQGNGNFANAVFDLNTSTQINHIKLTQSGTELISDWNLKAELNVGVDQNTSTYTIKDNRLKLNELAVQATGYVQQNADSVFGVDLSITAPDNSIPALFSLASSFDRELVQDFDSKGELSLKIDVKGDYKTDDYPAIDAFVLLKDGKLSHKDVNQSIEDIQLDLRATKEQGDLEKLVIALNNFSLKAAKNYLYLKASAKEITTEPDITLTADMNVDLSSLHDFYPNDALKELKGSVEGDLNIAGKANDFLSEDYSNNTFDGEIQINKIAINDTSIFPLEIKELSTQLSLAADKIEAKNTLVKIGSSDIAFTSTIQNAAAYYFSDKELSLEARANSDYLDLDEMSVAFEDTTESELAVIPLPERVKLIASYDADSIKFADTKLYDLESRLSMVDQKVSLDKVDADYLGGKISFNGAYEAESNQKAKTDLAIDLSKIDIATAFKSLSLFQNFLPIAENSLGTISLDYDMSTELNQDFSPVWSSLTMDGLLETTEALLNSDALSKLGAKLKRSDWGKVAVKDIQARFSVVDGKLFVKPFDYQFAGIQSGLSGSVGINGDMDMGLKFELPIDYAKQMVAGTALETSLSKTSVNSIPLNVGIGGTVKSPSFNLDSDKAIRNAAANQIDKAKQEAITKAKERAAKIRAEAEQRVEALLTSIADQKQKIIAVAEQKANELVDKAGSDPLKKTAAKLAASKIKKEARSQADKLEAETKEKVEKIRENANEQAEEIVKNAEGN